MWLKYRHESSTDNQFIIFVIFISKRLLAFSIGLVAQLQAHLAAQEHGIKCGQRFALTHNLFPFAPVVAPQGYKFTLVF